MRKLHRFFLLALFKLALIILIVRIYLNEVQREEEYIINLSIYILNKLISRDSQSLYINNAS